MNLYLHSLNTWRDAQLKHRDNLTFTFRGPTLSQDSMLTVIVSQKYSEAPKKTVTIEFSSTKQQIYLTFQITDANLYTFNTV